MGNLDVRTGIVIVAVMLVFLISEVWVFAGIISNRLAQLESQISDLESHFETPEDDDA